MEVVKEWSGMKHILNTELTGLTDALDGGWGKTSAKDTTKVFDLNNWVNGKGRGSAGG